MAAAQNLDRLHVPASICTSDSGHSSSDILHNQFAILSRSVSIRTHHSRSSRHSHHSHHSHASSHHSTASIRSHVSGFQNVRLDPDPIKDISFWGGLALLSSNMTGPGLVTLPIVAQSAGWLPTILGFGTAGILSSLSSLFICEAMTEVPGNDHFQSNVEFSNLVLCFFGQRYHLLVQIICFLAMQTTNIASIAVSAQLFDNLLIKIFHRTCGIQIYPSAALVCVTEPLQSASPFTGVMIMTTGVLLAFSMVLPLGLLRLSENIWVQLVSFGLLILIVIQWIVTFCMHGLDTTLVPAVGSDISQTFGTILFNYAFITTVPSWANAKKPDVSIHKTVGWSVGITTTIYIVVSILGGMAYKISSDSSLIQAISSSPDATALSQITGYIFPIAALITSIPINTIVIRYNLIQSGACNLMWANLCAGVLPWLVAIPCMTGSGLTTVINWCSLLLVSTAHFIIPFILYIYSKKHREKLSKLPILELEQRERLSREVSRSSLTGHSEHNTSVASSVRRRSQSHPDLNLTPPTGIAAATIIPVVVGIGSLIQYSDSAGSSAKEQHPTQKGSHHCSHTLHRHHQQQHSASNEPSSASDRGDPVNGPYFSYSQDGELFEPEPSAAHSQSPSHSSGSTVVLHDPLTEMAQHKVLLPRRVSHRDRILSMISDKHKRTIEQQSRIIEEEQSEKPVPPMILLSQSTAPEAEDDDDLNGIVEVGLYSQNSNHESSKSEEDDEKSVGMLSKGMTEASNASLSPIEKLNRMSSTLPANDLDRSVLGLPPSPHQPRNSRTPILSLGDHDVWEKALELSSTLGSPISPVGLGADATAGAATIRNLSSGPDSATSINRLERRVSFSDEIPVPTSGLERKHSFGDGTKRLVKAAVATLIGACPTSRSTKSGTAPSQEWKRTLLEEQAETEEGDSDDHQDAEDLDQDVVGPQLTLASGGVQLSVPITQINGTRRNSLSRMAAAFVVQPGSFSIETEALCSTRFSGRSDKDQTDLDADQGYHQEKRPSRRPSPSLTLSPSAPSTFQPDPSLAGRKHNRTVSASATRSQRRSGRTHSTLSLGEKTRQSQLSNHHAVPDPANSLSVHLMPPPLSFVSPTNIDTSSSISGEAKDPVPPLISFVPPSCRSVGSRDVQMSGSTKSLAAPFQEGHNYSVLGFSLSTTTSPLHSPSPREQSVHDQPQSARSMGSSWFHWRRHSREPSRTTIASAGMVHSGGSVPSSPHPSMLNAGGVGQRYGDRLLEPPCSTPGGQPVGAPAESSDAGYIEWRKSQMHATDLQASPHALENGQAQDVTWSLRAIPSWVPISSLKIAWGSLVLLVVAITATVIYDVVQVAQGHDVMSEL